MLVTNLETNSSQKLFLQRTNKICQTQVLPYSGSPSPQQASSRLIHVVHGYLGVIGLDPRGVTCKRDSEAQVSKISKKVKFGDQGSNECVPLIRGVHAYLQIINYVCHVMGWALVWAVGGPRPQFRPLVRLLLA